MSADRTERKRHHLVARRGGAATVVATLLLATAATPLDRPLLAQEAATATIRGTVRDREFLAPVAQARVQILGLMITGISSADGTFLLRNVPPGTYTLAVGRVGYERLLISDVVVVTGRLTEVEADLAPEVVDLDEMVVTGSDLTLDSEVGMLEVRATSVSLQDAISSELIGKAGASDVAGALKYVVGASVVGGKYATVRGLSDRYTGTTLNGVRIPSPDPRRRAVQLDLFPTGTVESVTVTKSFTPDLQGDFTGGGVDIQTKSVPEERVMSFTASLEYNTLATGDADFLTYNGGGVDALASDDGDRDLPSEALDPLPTLPGSFPTSPNSTQIAVSQEYDRHVRSFEPVMGVSEDAPALNSGFSVVAGDRFEFGDARVLGVMSGLSYTRKFDSYEDGINNNAGVSDPAQGITITHPRSDQRGQEEVLIGALANVVLRPGGNHELALKVVANQSAEDEARYQELALGTGGLVEQNQALHYTERSLLSFQLHGAHPFEGEHGPTIEWMASSNSTDQTEPDVRFFRNRFDSTATPTAPFGSGDRTFPDGSTDAEMTRRIFRDIDEENLQAAVHATVPISGAEGADGFLKGGLFTDRTDRVYTQHSFYYKFARQSGSLSNPDVRENFSYSFFVAESPDQLWTDVFLQPQRIGIASNTPPSPIQLLWVLQPFPDDVDYDGEQSIDALYAMGEFPVRRDLKIMAGVRRESTDLNIVPVNPFNGKVEVIRVSDSGDRFIEEIDDELAMADIQETLYLPAASVVWEPVTRMNVRLSWSRTLARPTFRELAPVATEEFIFGDEFMGNPELTLSRITNYDLRWEWFRRTGDVLAVSLFYKELQDPIEYISFAVSNRSFVQPLNYERGTVRGLELEARLGLDLFGESLRNWSIGANATWLDSEVEVPEDEKESLAQFGLAEETRALQGQPEYVYNLNVAYDDEDRGLSTALFYNRIGDTLLTGAARGAKDGLPNVYDEAYSTLDLTFSKRISPLVWIGIKAKNLLTTDRNTVYRRPNGEEALKSSRETASLYGASISLKW